MQSENYHVPAEKSNVLFPRPLHLEEKYFYQNFLDGIH